MQDYISKLVELILKQARVDRESAQMIAARNIKWKFDKYQKRIWNTNRRWKIKDDRHNVYSALVLDIPKKLISYIRKDTLLSVLILTENNKGEYIGTGIVE